MPEGKKIGVALGGGTIRGMSHIGVLDVLAENKIPVDILVGCSSGAIIAAAHACGKLKELKEIATSLESAGKRKILDFTMTGEGLIKGGKIRSLFNFLTAEKKFDDLIGINLSFVGTDAVSGNEVVVDKGSIAEALEITTALPGLSPPKRYEGKMVIDGGAVMMVPAKVAYSRGADIVIGVNVGVNRSFLTRTVGDIRKLMRRSGLTKLAKPIFRAQNKVLSADEKKFLGKAKEIMKKIRLLDDYEKHHFNFLEVYLLGLRAISQDYKKGIFQDSDCDIPIRPNVLHIKRMDMSKSPELIAEGRKATEEKIREIKKMLATRN
jgi:NTE family protein